MLYVLPDKTIRLTRGDTAYLTFIINTATEEEYVMAADDTLTLSVKKTVNDKQYLMRKTVKGTNALKIEPSDTQGLAFARYKYDVQLTKASGDVFTIIDVSVFEILPEVTCHE